MNTQPQEEPRKRILQAAIRLFARKGYAATGVRQIAREAGVNISMISYYFGSKRGLLEAVFDEFFGRYLSVVQRAIAKGDGYEGKMRNVICGLVNLLRENIELARVAILELPVDIPEMAKFKAERVRKIVALMTDEVLPLLHEKREGSVRIEIIGPAAIGGLFFHFLFRPVLENAFAVTFDDSFYEEFPHRLMDLLLYGTIGKRSSEDAGAAVVTR